MFSINWGAVDCGSVPSWAGVIALLVTIWKIFDKAKQRRDERAAYQIEQARLVVMVITRLDEAGFDCEASNFGSAHVAEVAPAIEPTDLAEA
jgi:hypothetical protein